MQRILLILSLLLVCIFVSFYLFTRFLGLYQIGSTVEHWGSEYRARYYVMVCDFVTCPKYARVPAMVRVKRHFGSQQSLVPQHRDISVESIDLNNKTYTFSPNCLVQSSYTKADNGVCSPAWKGQVDSFEKRSFKVKMTNEPVK